LAPRDKVCFGHVLYVRRSWVSKVHKGGTSRAHVAGHWTYWARVRVLGRDRLSMIDQVFFEDLRASGVPQRKDHCHFPDSEVKPPHKTVRVK
jgi:hypothetical protein